MSNSVAQTNESWENNLDGWPGRIWDEVNRVPDMLVAGRGIGQLVAESLVMRDNLTVTI